MSGGDENEFVSSEELFELSGTVKMHHHIPPGLAGADMNAFSHPLKHDSSVSRVAVFIFKVAMLYCGAKSPLSISVKELHHCTSQEGTSPVHIYTYICAGERSATSSTICHEK